MKHLREQIVSGADLSECGRYRFNLWRAWAAEKGWALFCGLNPSTADATKDDPTIRRSEGLGAYPLALCQEAGGLPREAYQVRSCERVGLRRL